MITITYPLATGLIKFATNTPVKAYGVIPLTLVFDSAPGTVSSIKFSLGDDSDAPAVLAYTDVWTQQNATTWTAALDATDARLATFMAGKQSTTVDLELIVTIDGVTQYSPNLALTVQQP